MVEHRCKLTVHPLNSMNSYRLAIGGQPQVVSMNKISLCNLFCGFLPLFRTVERADRKTGMKEGV